MRISFYGARGSLATPLLLEDYQKKIRKILELYKKSQTDDIEEFLLKLPFNLSHIYGGNTACVTLEEKNKDIIILDAGSGLRVLGNKFVKKNNQTFHIFLTHFHWDHICGIPFFKPLYNPTNTVVFYTPDENVIQNLCRQQHKNHFPFSFPKMPSKKKFVILDKQGHYNLNGFRIKNVSLNHPGGSTAYVFRKEGKKISYVTDTEFTPETLEEDGLYYKACFETSDILICDSQYSLKEIFMKFDWGHTSCNMAVNLALEWRVKKLVLFHFDPEHTDEELFKMLKEADTYKGDFNRRSLKIMQAVEGKYIDI